jgi:hypothetical protein
MRSRSGLGRLQDGTRDRPTGRSQGIFGRCYGESGRSQASPATTYIVFTVATSGHRAQGEPGGLFNVARVATGAKTGGYGDEFLRRETAQALPQRLRRRRSRPQAPELVSSLRPCLGHRRAACGPQGPDHLHAAVRALLGLPGRLSGLFPARAALSASRESVLPLR